MSAAPMAPSARADRWDAIVVGAGAAGLMAAIWAARRGRRVVVLDGARTLGAKILVAGGGRCNVTHETVDERAFSGSSRPAIRKVLSRFTVSDTVAFFRELGVGLKREETGKLFPTTDSARTVLDALLRAAVEAGCDLRHPRRVESVTRGERGFTVAGAWGACSAPRVVLATGGKSLPKTGSDGFGHELARALGHSISPEVFPALVPLLLPEGHALRELSGIASDAVVRVVGGTGKRLTETRGAVLCAHFGLSGPAILDISRHLSEARRADPLAHLELAFLPDETEASLERGLSAAPSEAALAWLRGRLPERLARALLSLAGVEPSVTLRQLSRDARRSLARALARLSVRPTGDRGFAHAEVTAGGVPLSEVRLESMESRVAPGLHLVGEILDVDGRIGGFNFQWAWASGFVAGTAIGAAATRSSSARE